MRRNRGLALVLAAFAALVFTIAIAKMIEPAPVPVEAR